MMRSLQSRALRQLSTHNEVVLKSLFGSDFIQRSRKGDLSPEETRSANYKLAEHLYSKKTAEQIYSGQYMELHAEYDLGVKRILTGRPKLPWDEFAFILVRPELYHARESVIEFLAVKGFQVIYEQASVIDFAKYRLLYHPGLIDPQSRDDFPTRTLCYINQPCWFIVFSDPRNRYDAPLSDGFTNELKGERGNFKPGTLRGELVPEEMLALNLKLPLNGEVALAFDPIQAYRHIIAGTITSDRVHEKAESPLLFYAGVGIHMPDASEIERDMNILFSPHELLRISHEYENRANYSHLH